jgi:hypothetical protein
MVLALVPQITAGRMAHWLITAAVLCSPLLTGCVTTGITSWVNEKEPVPEIQVSQVATVWENQVFPVPDPVHNGQPNPCLAGRVFLYGPETKDTLEAKGTLSVQLYVEMPPETGQPARLLEQWNYPDPEQLKRLFRKDIVGSGYTLVLPWSTFSPNITNVEMVVCYMPKQGLAIYDRSRLRLEPQRPTITISKGVQLGAPGLPGVYAMQPNGNSMAPFGISGQGAAAPPQPAGGMAVSRFTLGSSPTAQGAMPRYGQ